MGGQCLAKVDALLLGDLRQTRKWPVAGPSEKRHIPEGENVREALDHQRFIHLDPAGAIGGSQLPRQGRGRQACGSDDHADRMADPGYRDRGGPISSTASPVRTVTPSRCSRALA